MDRTIRRRLVALWLRVAVVCVALAAMPFAATRLLAFLEPHAERDAVARAAERQQRDGGVVFVTPSGERRRAVVFTPSDESKPSPDATRRGMLWWSAILASVVLLGAIRTTVRMRRVAALEESDHVTRRPLDSGE